MRRFWRVVGLGFLLLWTGVAFAQSFSRPLGSFSTSFDELAWEPDCVAPVKPLRRNQAGVDAYNDQVRQWVQCVNDQASSDADYAAARISAGREEALRKMLEEIRRP